VAVRTLLKADFSQIPKQVRDKREMTANEGDKYAASKKKVWVIYILAVACLIAYLFTIVAQDNEEMFFYTLMTAAASYVFRPNDKLINKAVMRLFGVAPPVETDDS
jgi:hypothetical protein